MSTERPIVDRLDLVFYWVADMTRAVAFYRDVLGLTLIRQDGDNWAELEAGGRRLALHGTGEGQPVPAGGATAVFAVADLDRAKAALSKRGVSSTHDGDGRQPSPETAWSGPNHPVRSRTGPRVGSYASRTTDSSSNTDAAFAQPCRNRSGSERW